MSELRTCGQNNTKNGKLLPCPFCGGEAELHTSYDMDTGEVDGWFVWCNNKECECAPETREHFTEAEAIAAWNTRAAYEIDGWFYLPKPKEQLFDYTTEFTFDDLSLKATGSVDMYALVDAVRKWQKEELNKHIVERICEVFKPERTCKNNAPVYLDFLCSECGFVHYHSEANDTGEGNEWNYCPNCGARVIKSDQYL